MKHIRVRMAFLGLSVVLLAARVQAQDVMIVANKDIAVSQISSAELRDIFTGARSRFSDGSRAVPVVLKGGPTHEVFLNHYVKDNPNEFRIRWRKAIFTGQGSMPKEFNSEAELLQYVAATHGAIGYASRVDDTTAVKVLVIAK